MNETKDLSSFAEFFKSVGEHGATREDMLRKFRISSAESSIVMKHLVSKGVVRTVGRKHVGGKTVLSVYQFACFEFRKLERTIVSVRDAIDIVGHDEDFEAWIEPMPTHHPAGSPEKIEVLRKWVQLGMKLFSEFDCKDVVAT